MNRSESPESGNEIVLYQPNEEIRLEVRLENETVWLNRHQLSLLFDRDIKTIGKHIHNALQEELNDISVVANFATTANDGKTYQVEYYNLDMILSIGYRVKSNRGITFRRWANQVLKNYFFCNYSINRRFESLERRVSETEEKIDFFVRTSLPPVEGIFYDGNMLESFGFVNGLIRSAKQRIVLIDNYVDDTVLLRLAERGKGVHAEIHTQHVSPSFAEALKRHNAQYEEIVMHTFTKSHDRFLIIDDDVYHIGASIKDLGKRWIAFSRMEIPADEILEWLNSK